MHKNYKHFLTQISFIVICNFLFFATISCTGSKKINTTIINDIPDSPKIALPELKYPSAIIQVDDILEIKILAKNNDSEKTFNEKGSGYLLSSTAAPNYLVDKDGNIEIYKIGKIQVAGLTKDELRTKLIKLLSSELQNTNVTVRFINFRFTILGEVKLPGTFTILNDKISILEAFGYAGDFTQFGKRNNVRIIRDSSGFREIGLVNFNQKTLFTSPYYYLHRNDIIVVEGDFNAKRSSETISKISTSLSIVTGLITLLFLFLKK